MESAFNEFGRRYFRWSVDSALREMQQGCPRLQLMHTGSSLRYLRNLEQMTADKSQVFVLALLKQRLFKEFLTNEINGETLSASERSLCEMYFDHPRPREPEDLRFERLEAAQPEKFKISRRALANLTCEVFQGHGYNMVHAGPAETWYSHRSQIAPVRSCQMSYSHRITGPNHYMLHGVISIVSWMGFSGGE